ELGVLVREDLRAARAERLVHAGVLVAPARVEQELDRLARVSLADQREQVRRAVGRTAVDEQRAGRAGEHDDVRPGPRDREQPWRELRGRERTSGLAERETRRRSHGDGSCDARENFASIRQSCATPFSALRAKRASGIFLVSGMSDNRLTWEAQRQRGILKVR